jgi:hypothetical protein
VNIETLGANRPSPGLYSAHQNGIEGLFRIGESPQLEEVVSSGLLVVGGAVTCTILAVTGLPLMRDGVYNFDTSSAICTAFVAAPLRKLSATTHRLSPFAMLSSRRTRPTKTSSFPSAYSGMG